MQAFEIQVYQNGRWEFDSYFDDRELVLSEAERLGHNGRFAGVRVLEEIYHGETNRSDCRVIFSRLAHNFGPNSDWREKVQHRATRPAGEGTAGPGRRYTGPRQAARPRKRTNIYLLLTIAAVVVLTGIAAIIAIRRVAGVA